MQDFPELLKINYPEEYQKLWEKAAEERETQFFYSGEFIDICDEKTGKNIGVAELFYKVYPNGKIECGYSHLKSLL